MTDGKIIIQKHIGQRYTTYFDQTTGLFVRKEDINANEPFWSEDGPELLDISITNFCELSCSFCYRQSNNRGEHMSYSDFQKIIEQAANIGVLQIALGGGNPNQHPKFVHFLKLIREHNIQQFVVLPNDKIEQLSQKVEFTIWVPFDEKSKVCRFVTSRATTEEQMKELEMWV